MRHIWKIRIIGCMSFSYLFSPLAGYIADVKSSRYKVLQYSTCLMVIATIFGLLGFVLWAFKILSSNSYYFIIPSVIFILLYFCGNVMFYSNIIQFGTDQLRDLPTPCTVYFLYSYLWCESLCTTLVLSANFLGYDIHAAVVTNRSDTIKMITIIVGSVLSIFSTLVVVCFVKRKKDWFSTENIEGNSYQLVSGVLRFAIYHKKPIRRSAFTFCEFEFPSRIDFGKKRYGGPYTTEQVEDVKALINILRILITLGPTFLLELTTTLSAINYDRDEYDFRGVRHTKARLLNHGILSPLFTVILIPAYLFLIKPLFSRCAFNMFRRMGFSIVLLLISIMLFLLYDITAYDHSNVMGNVYDTCSDNSSYIINRNVVHIPSTYIVVVQQILLSLSHTLLYIGAWEFICSQSPHHMKGFLFGIFLAIRGLFQFLAIILLYIFLFAWKTPISSCHTGYYFLATCMGIISLVLYTIASKRYRYRKRDDICNVHLFAEEYYSKYGSMDEHKDT